MSLIALIAAILPMLHSLFIDITGFLAVPIQCLSRALSILMYLLLKGKYQFTQIYKMDKGT
jgi:hypothetical protein